MCLLVDLSREPRTHLRRGSWTVKMWGIEDGMPTPVAWLEFSRGAVKPFSGVPGKGRAGVSVGNPREGIVMVRSCWAGWRGISGRTDSS